MPRDSIHVLFVGDKQSDRRPISDCLARATNQVFRLTTATTLAEALTFLKNDSPDIVLLDPKISSGEKLSALSIITKRYFHIPVIVFSAEQDQEAAVRMIREGAQDYLIEGKVDADLLVRTIRCALERKKTHESLWKIHNKKERREGDQTSSRETADERLDHEITEPTTIEQALKSEKKWRTFFEESGDAMFIASIHEWVVEINRACCALLGYPDHNTASLSLDEIFTDPTQKNRLFRQIDNKASVKDYPIILRRTDTSTMNCVVTANISMDDSGKVTGYQGIIRDVSYRVSFMDKALSSVTDGVLITDQKKRITYLNTAARKILDIPRDNDSKRYIKDIVYEQKRWKSPLIRAYDDGMEVLDEADTFVTTAGIPISVSLSTGVLNDNSGRDVGFIVIFRDISAIDELKKEIEDKYTQEDIISKNNKIREIFDILPSIAESDSTVLIEGKSGTGKELFARAIHNLSSRKQGPFVAVNCGALPDTLLESELFGYVKGAFTNALINKPGRFAIAAGGTILLDEIGDLKKHLQVKLLRVLEQQTYEPLGSVIPEISTARVIASTNRDLAREVDLGNFREDLYYRINVVRIALPDLKERREDIQLLVRHFIKKHSLKMGRRPPVVSDEVMDLFMKYDFPGNVRELENLIQRMIVMSSGGVIDMRNLPNELLTAFPEEQEEFTSFKEEMMGSEKRMIEEVLARYHGNRNLAARALNIDRTTLWRKMHKYRILKEKVEPGS